MIETSPTRSGLQRGIPLTARELRARQTEEAGEPGERDDGEGTLRGSQPLDRGDLQTGRRHAGDDLPVSRPSRPAGAQARRSRPQSKTDAVRFILVCAADEREENRTRY